MKSFAAAAALAATVPFVLGQGLQVNSLSGVIECEPVLVSWSGGSPPYYVSFIPGGQPSAPAIKQFAPQQGTSFTWNVDLPAGTEFSTELKDASGQPVYSGIQKVEAGDSTSCENTAVVEGSSSTATSQTPAAAAAASTTDMTMATSSHATSTAPGSSSGSGSATSSGSVTHITAAVQSSASTTTTSTATATATQNAARQGSSVNAFGIAGLLGLVGAALF